MSFCDGLHVIACDCARLPQVGNQGQPLIEMLGFIDKRALDFDETTCYRDVCYLGDCDAAVRELAR